MHPDLRSTLTALTDEDASVRLVGLYVEDAIYRRRFGTVRLSFAQIAEGAGVHADTSYRAVHRLMQIGFLQRVKTGGRHNASVYAMSGRSQE
ncbi:hypothetical protein LCGC14_2469880 [marine sediment metagenome]|uniref:HTH iclR-type domain-containing protein n=1 Tax=marine sediment metagenome TaxID=412755 RepID=A0A0F9BAL8_9ZZZZ